MKMQKHYPSHAGSITDCQNERNCFETTFNEAAVGIANVGPDGRFLRINHSFCDLIGYSADEIIGKTFQQITHPDDLQSDLDHVRSLLEGGADNYTMEKRYITKHSSLVWVDLSVQIVRDSDGSPQYFIAVVKDISDRKLLEEKLSDSYQRISEAREVWVDTVDAINDPIFVHDPGGKIIRANEAYRQMAGMKFKELIGRVYWKVFPIDDGPSPACEAGALDGQTHEERFNMEGKWWHTRSFALDQDSGIPGFGLHVMRDVTEEVQAQESIRQYVQTLRIISLANQKLIRISTETELLQDVCNVIVENSRRYSAAWIGIFDMDRQLRLRGLSGDGSIISLNLLHSKIIPLPEGCPITRAIALKKTVLCNIGSDSACLQACETFATNARQSLIILPLTYETDTFGAMVIYTDGEKEVVQDEVDLFTELAGDTSYGIYSRRLQTEHQRLSAQQSNHQQQLLEQTLLAFGRMVEARDPYTAGHQFRVAHLASTIARELGWDEQQVTSVWTAGMIHDIGKIKLPADILSRPGALEAAEFELLKTHSAIGEKMLRDIVFDTPIAAIVGQHHERIDGSGYPLGLRENQILPEAKLIGVADVVEAMMNHRPYRSALGLDTALEEIVRYRGIHFDSLAVDACVTLFRKKGYIFPPVASQ